VTLPYLFLAVAGLADLDEAGVARLAANAVSASFLDPIAKHKLLAEIDEWSAA
jgi:aminodeoxyfutalosine deaminase